jgi:hypothetical protein
MTSLVFQYDGAQHYSDALAGAYHRAETLIEASASATDAASRHAILTLVEDLYRQPLRYLAEAQRPALELLLDFVVANQAWYDEHYCSRSSVKVYSELATWMAAHRSLNSPLSFFMAAYGTLWAKQLTE